MYSVGNTILKAILNGSGTEEEHIMLNNFSCLVQFLRSITTDRCVCLFEYAIPLLEFFLGNLPHRKAKCPQTFRRVFFEMLKGGFHDRVSWRQPLENDSICSFSVASNLPIRASEYRRHSLSSGVELANCQQLILIVSSF